MLAIAKQLTTKLCILLLLLLPWEFAADLKGRAENDVSSWVERAVATNKPPPLPAISHQVRTGMRVIEDRPRYQHLPGRSQP
jgi:hypothetical protein